MNIFCTYFDRGYLTRGLGLYRSLARWGEPFQLWVLCLDDACRDALARLDNPHMKLVSLETLQRADPAFRRAANDRSRIAYYFTSTPVFLDYLLHRPPPGALVTYLDADLFFFGSPSSLFAALTGASCGLIEHRFPAALAALSSRGIYNVGWVSLRNDTIGRDCAAWWRERCLEWCHDRVEDGRFADQKYLDLVPHKFDAVTVLDHPGANLAPWNVARHRLSIVDGRPFVDDQPLIFFHFHGMRQIANRLYSANFGNFAHKPDPALIDHLYRPYLHVLAEETARVATLLGETRQGALAQGRGPSLGLREIVSLRFAWELLRGRTVLLHARAPQRRVAPALGPHLAGLDDAQRSPLKERC